MRLTTEELKALALIYDLLDRRAASERQDSLVLQVAQENKLRFKALCILGLYDGPYA
jgi:hypothetical protein